MREEEAQRLVHELQVHQVELEMQNEELLKTRGELEALLAKYTDLYDFAPVGYFTLDRDGIILAANRTGSNLLGTGCSLLTGNKLGQFISDATRPAFNDLLDKVFFSWENETCEVEIRNKRQTPLFARIEALASESEEECRAAVIDITEHRRMETELQQTVEVLRKEVAEREKIEQQLLQSQKMESVGLLAGGVAHEFNNMLTAISGYGEEIRDSIPEDNEHLRECIAQVLKGAERAAELTGSLLAFSRKQENNPKPVMVDAIIANTVKLIRRVIGEDVELGIVLSSKRLPVMADTGQIEHVLLNLATNARDAMPGGGRLSITTRDVTVTEGSEKSYDLPVPGRYALISVADTGTGIKKELLARLFEPFYTTKDVGKGTGLGLSIVYGIVKQHSGSVMVDSKPGKGTTFNIYLPITEGRTAEEKAKRAATAGGGTETLLVVEDEEIVRVLMKQILEKAGYKVLIAGNADDAVALFRDHDDISLILSDVIMPGKNGRELVDELKRIKNGTRAIFISGYTSDIIRKKGILEADSEIITKPFAKDDLLIKIREVLNRI